MRTGNTLPPVTEKVWQAQVIGLAKTFGYRVYHPFLSKWSEKGYPDLTLVSERQKRVIWIECKTETGKVTPSQQEWLDALKEAGQEAYVFRPSDWDNVAKILQERSEFGAHREGESKYTWDLAKKLEQELVAVTAERDFMREVMGFVSDVIEGHLDSESKYVIRCGRETLSQLVSAMRTALAEAAQEGEQG